MLQLRGSETSLMIMFDGQLQMGSSFAKIENWTMTPMTELRTLSFVGQQLHESDLIHHGFNFSFTIRECQGDFNDIMDNIITNINQGTAQVDISFIITKKYRDPVLPTVLNCAGVTFKVDDETVGGRKDYAKAKISGFCKEIKKYL